MNTDSQSNNKRIAKNTLFMYFRMFITMVVGIYTSRIILASLGVVDYGVYNVVGGIVGMLSFLNGAMSTATSTYLTRAIGEGDYEQTRSVFSTSIYLHLFLAILIVVLAEIIGVWFLECELNIPDGRLNAARFVFQLSVLSAAVSICNVPHSALVIANEHMNFYAYSSVFEVSMKLIIAFIIPYSPIDSLVFYGGLIALCSIVVQIAFIVYDKIHFKQIFFIWEFSKEQAKKMVSFVSWNLFANVAIMLMLQGTNMVLNVFFGPVVNAARAVCTQVQQALTQFYTNVQFAINPQITKSYAQNNIAQMKKYMFASARLSFVVMFMLGLPFLFVCDYVLKIWLETPPEYASEFIRLGLMINVIDAVSNPFIVGCLATGRIKKLMLICGSMFCMVLPISYILFKVGCPPYYAYVSQFTISFIAFFVRLFIVEDLLGISKWDFLKNVALKMICIAIVSYVLVFITNYFYNDETFMHLILIVLLSVIVVSVLSYAILIERMEKNMIKNIVRNKILKK